MPTKVEFLHADQIGGCVTLISTDTTKICIDFGENLPGSKYKEALEVEGLTYGEASYDAVFFTHYHGDHIGRFDKILPQIPLYMSRMCRYALLNIYHVLVKHDKQYQNQIDILEDAKSNHVIWPQEAVQIGDIKVTPYTIDHSAEVTIFLHGTQAARKLKKLSERYRDLEPVVIYSMWSGYITDEKAEYYNAELAQVCAACNTLYLHTSGHATKEVVEELIELINARDYTAVIHSERAEIRRKA